MYEKRKEEIDKLLKEHGYKFYRWDGNRLVLSTSSVSEASAIKYLLISNFTYYDHATVDIEVSLKIKG